jgi:flagellin-like protein
MATMSRIASKKGITPIIATILLLMMAVAIAASSFFWISRVQNQMQGGTESFQSTLMTQMTSAVKVVGVDAGCYGSDICSNITIFFQNTGNTKIPIANSSSYPTTTWILRDENQITVCSTHWNSTAGTGALCIKGCGNTTFMEVGQTSSVTLNLTDPCNISLATIGSDRGKSFSFTVD